METIEILKYTSGIVATIGYLIVLIRLFKKENYTNKILIPAMAQCVFEFTLIQNYSLLLLAICTFFGSLLYGFISPKYNRIGYNELLAACISCSVIFVVFSGSPKFKFSPDLYSSVTGAFSIMQYIFFGSIAVIIVVNFIGIIVDIFVQWIAAINKKPIPANYKSIELTFSFMRFAIIVSFFVMDLLIVIQPILPFLKAYVEWRVANTEPTVVGTPWL